MCSLGSTHGKGAGVVMRVHLALSEERPMDLQGSLTKQSSQTNELWIQDETPSLNTKWRVREKDAFIFTYKNVLAHTYKVINNSMASCNK